MAAPILSEYRVPGSVYVVSDWSRAGLIGTPSTCSVGRIPGARQSGHRDSEEPLGQHPTLASSSRAASSTNSGRSRRMIEDRLGIVTTSFAIPFFGQSKNWPELAARAAREVGYDVLLAQAEETRPAGTVARTFVTRFDGDRIFSALLGGAFDRWEERV